MRKLKLNLDEIKVESFNITEELSQTGTVLANEEEGSGAPLATICVRQTCVGYPCGGGGVGTLQTDCGQLTCNNTYCYDTCACVSGGVTCSGERPDCTCLGVWCT